MLLLCGPILPKTMKKRYSRLFRKPGSSKRKFKSWNRIIKRRTANSAKHATLLNDKIKPALDTIEQKLAAKSAEIDTYQKQITQLDVAEFASQTAEQIKYRIHAQNTAYQKLTDDYERLTKQIQVLADQQNILSGEITSLKTNTQQQAEALRELKDNLDKDIASSDFADESEIVAMLQSELDIAAEQKQIETYRLALNTARASLKSLEEKTDGLRYDAEIHQKLRVDLEEKTDRLNELRKEEGGLANQVSKQEQDLAQQGDLRKEKDKLDVRAGDIDTLDQIVQG